MSGRPASSLARSRIFQPLAMPGQCESLASHLIERPGSILAANAQRDTKTA